MSSQSSSTTQWSLDGDRSASVTVLPSSWAKNGNKFRKKATEGLAKVERRLCQVSTWKQTCKDLRDLARRSKVSGGMLVAMETVLTDRREAAEHQLWLLLKNIDVISEGGKKTRCFCGYTGGGGGGATSTGMRKKTPQQNVEPFFFVYLPLTKPLLSGTRNFPSRPEATKTPVLVPSVLLAEVPSQKRHFQQPRRQHKQFGHKSPLAVGPVSLLVPVQKLFFFYIFVKFVGKKKIRILSKFHKKTVRKTTHECV